MAQQKFYEAAAEVEARDWEKEILTSLLKRSVWSSNLNDISNIKQVNADQAQRDKNLACMENRN